MTGKRMGQFSLNNKRAKVVIETADISRGELFDRLLASVTVSIYQMVKSRVGLTDEKVTAAFESRGVLNLVKRHMRDENIQMVDESNKPRFKRAMSLIAEDTTQDMGEEGKNDFEKIDPNELRTRVTDQAVYEVCEAVKRHSAK